MGIISNPDMSGLENSAKKLQCTLLLKFKPHYVTSRKFQRAYSDLQVIRCRNLGLIIFLDGLPFFSKAYAR